jgi:hypothetical protein
MSNTGIAILEILESPQSNGTPAKSIICFMNFLHLVLSGAIESYAAFNGVLSKKSGLKSLNPPFTVDTGLW